MKIRKKAEIEKSEKEGKIDREKTAGEREK